ncbi:hypothetical protein H2200_008553 [Cladophialophora chaetospira]|uniref:Uncharacterized protein n=1 Tax=Cladophialophora chaetospira TaxID=386627 RepID=A0AA38X4L2_9EURO|nr:hypothetical protein H2200_008553 [Cladophialophora chaetospira]
MGGSHSTPILRPKDLERWHGEGRPIRIDESCRGRGPGGRTYTASRQRYTQGNPFDGFGPGAGRGPPTFGLGENLPGQLPPVPGLYPGPTGCGPDVRVPGYRPQYRDRAYMYDPPNPLERVLSGRSPLYVQELGPGMVAIQEMGPNLSSDIRWMREPDMYFGGPSPYPFDRFGDGFPPRRAYPPNPIFIFTDDMYRGRDRSFGAGRGPFPGTGRGRGRAFPFDFPDEASQSSWGPVRRGGSPAPGSVHTVEDDAAPEGTRPG